MPQLRPSQAEHACPQSEFQNHSFLMFRGGGHVALSILLINCIFYSSCRCRSFNPSSRRFVAISSAVCHCFKAILTCWNFTLTGLASRADILRSWSPRVPAHEQECPTNP